ncbi:MAG: hypothetical protein E2590_05995 [Chryseobacterium sp.]|nr:hypothetical protein [Chryseobacterium sp.]
MKINNRKSIAMAMYGFLFIILLDIVFLLFGKKFFAIDDIVLYSFSIAVFILCVWRIATLKSFSLDVSEQIISVKYSHPLSRVRRPVLEVPLYKVVSMNTEKAILHHIMVIGILTKKGIRNFYYRIGNLPSNEAEKLKRIKDLITTYNKVKS